ncbi:MAG: hydantoinase B/oxoprolinase family protein [Rhodospirillaceae bacterium]|nr:hydantoinase B/oxoprolinase family protein [Rhodospirillaceae bacterium]
MTPAPQFDPITFQVLWSRAINIADEMATTLVQTAFSTVVRDNHDFAVGIYDAKGDLIAQANQSTPGQLYCMQRVMKDLLETCPSHTLAKGDVLIANDPWLGSGHTPDIFIATPTFRGDDLVGFGVTCAHHTDIGGRLAAPDAREVYEEGIIIPITKLYDKGQPNELLFQLIERNVRIPHRILGDLRAQMAANHFGGQRLVEFLDESGLDQLSDLTDAVAAQTEQNMRSQIAALPDGVFENEIELEEEDPAGKRLVICSRLEVRGDEIFIDYAGTSPQVPLPINSVLNMTTAYSTFAIKCALTPHSPNNKGTSAPIHVSAPEGSILNPTFPAAVMHRTAIVFYCVQAIFQQLAAVKPDRVMAPCGTYPLWVERFAGKDHEGNPYVVAFNAQGGQGARFDQDGVATTVFPANVSSTSIELLEAEAPLLCDRKQLITDSGGPGRQRGGLGQEVVLRNLAKDDALLSLSGGRFHIAAPGMDGGGQGTLGIIRLDDGSPEPRRRQALLGQDGTALFAYPGGGGYGPPYERDPAMVLDDVRKGYVSRERAETDYGLVLSNDGTAVDTQATIRKRAS